MFALHPKLKAFYNSQDWINFRTYMIADHVAKNGGLICDHCHKPILRDRDLTLHHVVPLTPDNVDDVMISLNPANIIIIHSHPCHDEIHGRFGHDKERSVYIVYGAPLSGKKTYVRERKYINDIVADKDLIYQSITMLDIYNKPDILLNTVSSIYDSLLDNIMTRYGKWQNAWIIGGYADKYKREQLAEQTGAELILCEATREECLARLEIDPDRRAMKKEWTRYIDDWFDRYIA